MLDFAKLCLGCVGDDNDDDDHHDHDAAGDTLHASPQQLNMAIWPYGLMA